MNYFQCVFAVRFLCVLTSITTLPLLLLCDSSPAPGTLTFVSKKKMQVDILPRINHLFTAKKENLIAPKYSKKNSLAQEVPQKSDISERVSKG